MAQTLHFVTAEAASGKDEPRRETQILRLELGIPVASPWNQSNLVCAGSCLIVNSGTLPVGSLVNCSLSAYK
jgi:hypothetical protein